MAEAFIEAKNLRKTYHVGKIEVEALRGISFSVQKGEFVSVVGPSGSGKSTLFYLLGGLTRADGGSVVLDGDDLATLSDAERTRMRKRKIGFVFQKFNLLPTLDARSNIDIAREISGNGDGDPAHFNRITDLLGLTKRLEHRPSELSGGEQQRVALARALINKPAVVLADEPTGNLDSKNSDVVLSMLRKSNQELGQTVLMITHNPAGGEVRRPDHPHARRADCAAGRGSAVGAALSGGGRLRRAAAFGAAAGDARPFGFAQGRLSARTAALLSAVLS